MDVECIYSFFITTPAAFSVPPTIEIRELSGSPATNRLVDITYNNGPNHGYVITARWFENLKANTGLQLAITSSAAANPAFTITTCNFTMAPLKSGLVWGTPS
jgi:hypothetical protein